MTRLTVRSGYAMLDPFKGYEEQGGDSGHECDVIVKKEMYLRNANTRLRLGN